MLTFPISTAVGLALIACSGSALAQVPPPPQGLLTLGASASVEVTKDLLSVVLSVTRDAPDAAAVQAQLGQALDQALAEAKKAARPGQLDVHTGSFALFPRYSNQPDGRGGIIGWQGSSELVLEGRDMPAIGQLVGRISSMTVARVSYELSREAREKVESELAAQAIASYRSKAADYARAFGYAGYTPGTVNVSTSEPPHPGVPLMRKAMSAADSALPVEPGKGEVTVSVSGTVQMK